MSEDINRTVGGVLLLDDNLENQGSHLSGVGAPGGDGGRQDAARLGSTYMQTDVDGDGLQLWVKESEVSNTVADWDRVTNKSYVDSVVGTGTSWREPALLRDGTLYANVVGWGRTSGR